MGWRHARVGPLSIPVFRLVGTGALAVLAVLGVVTVDESLLPTGSLVVRARDARRGTPITSFCATAVNEVLFKQACTDDGSDRLKH